MKIGHIELSNERAGPGRRALTIFFQGCQWRCPTCPHPELVLPQLYEVPVAPEAITQWLQDNRQSVDAIVLGGGEPTAQEGLADFVETLRPFGLPIHLDTNGCHPETLQVLFIRGLVDFVTLDLKGPLANYAQATGARVEVERIRTTFWLLRQGRLPYAVRLSPVPGMHTVDELRSLASGFLKGAQQVILQGFDPARALRPDYRLRPPFPEKTLNSVRNTYVARGIKCEVRPAFSRGTKLQLASPEVLLRASA